MNYDFMRLSKSKAPHYIVDQQTDGPHAALNASIHHGEGPRFREFIVILHTFARLTAEWTSLEPISANHE